LVAQRKKLKSFKKLKEEILEEHSFLNEYSLDEMKDPRLVQLTAILKKQENGANTKWISMKDLAIKL